MELLLVHVPPAPERAFPLGLGYLAAGAKQAGIPVSGVDADLDGEGFLFRRASDPAVRWVGLSSFTRSWPRTARIARALKALRPDATVILGGPHVTCLPGPSLETSRADVAVLGEGERTFGEFLRRTRSGKGGWKSIRGIAFLEKGRLVTTPRRRPVPIDTLPFPDRDFLPVRVYGYAMMAQATPYASLVTSRGCTLACTYCPSPALWNGGWRGRSPENILEEMRAVDRRYGIRHFIFEDDHFLASRERVRDLCCLLGLQGRRFSWELSNGIPPEHIDPDEVPLLARGGCVSLTLGLETRHLGAAVTGRKPYREEHAVRVIEQCHRHGIFAGGYFMLGFPGETLRQMRANAADARRLPLDSAHFSILEPLPGAPCYEDRASLLRNRPPAARLAAIQREAYLRFYLRPRILRRVFRALRRNPRLAGSLAGKFRDTMLGPLQG